MNPLRLGLVCDYPEEGWVSMDVVAEQVRAHLEARHAGTLATRRVCPPFRRRFGRGPLRRVGAAVNADRLLNRFVHYPRALAEIAARNEYDIYHLVDHSYAQLVPVLPAGRTVVTCHDLDTFRCLLDPAAEPRPRWFRAMTRRVLAGFRQAAAVVCDSAATAQAVRAHGLVAEERLHVVPLGVAEGFSADPDPAADAQAQSLLGGPPRDDAPEVLHVGTTIPRKRIDVLLRVYAAARAFAPGSRLIRVGPSLTPDQAALARALAISDDQIITLEAVNRPVLAALYRRAALVLLPSAAEGFGLPVVEALACGTPVLASDLDVLREVGGTAATYAPLGDIPAWTAMLAALFDERRDRPDAWEARRAEGIAHAGRSQWSAHVDRLAAIYQTLWEDTRRPPPQAGPQALQPGSRGDGRRPTNTRG